MPANEVIHIKIRVKAGARKDSITQESGSRYEITVKERAAENRANEAALAILAAHLRKPRKALRIVSGHHATSKLVEIHN